MSNSFQPKRKEYATVKAVSSEEYSNKRFEYDFVGCVQRGYSGFVTSRHNRKTGLCTFYDDTSSLTRSTKNQIVKFFSNHENDNKNTVYLVREKKADSSKDSK